eukprot:506102-Rhodomonas_salina.1
MPRDPGSSLAAWLHQSIHRVYCNKDGDHVTHYLRALHVQDGGIRTVSRAGACASSEARPRIRALQ